MDVCHEHAFIIDAQILYINGTLFVVIMYRYYITIYEIIMYTHMQISVIHKAKYVSKRRQDLIRRSRRIQHLKESFHDERKSTKMSKISRTYLI